MQSTFHKMEFSDLKTGWRGLHSEKADQIAGEFDAGTAAGWPVIVLSGGRFSSKRPLSLQTSTGRAGRTGAWGATEGGLRA